MFIKYILFILLFKVLFFAKRSASDLKCIKANKWQNLTSSTKTLDYSNTCTSISSSCCYINMTYSYINFDVSSQYCASLSGNLDDFKEYLNNLYQDDVLFFSNYTYRNKANYKYLGRQLDYNYTQNYSCFKAPLNKTTVLIFITTVDNLTKMADAYLRKTHITLVTSQIRSIEITQRSIAIS